MFIVDQLNLTLKTIDSNYFVTMWELASDDTSAYYIIRNH